MKRLRLTPRAVFQAIMVVLVTIASVGALPLSRADASPPTVDASSHASSGRIAYGLHGSGLSPVTAPFATATTLLDDPITKISDRQPGAPGSSAGPASPRQLGVGPNATIRRYAETVTGSSGNLDVEGPIANVEVVVGPPGGQGGVASNQDTGLLPSVTVDFGAVYSATLVGVVVFCPPMKIASEHSANLREDLSCPQYVDSFEVSADGVNFSSSPAQGGSTDYEVVSPFGPERRDVRYVKVILELGPGLGNVAEIQAVFLEGGPAEFDAPSGSYTPPDSCAANTAQASAADPVNTSSGNFHYEHTDLAVPARGFPLDWTRVHNSLAGHVGHLGLHWTHNYQSRVAALRDQDSADVGATVIDDAGNRYDYYKDTYDEDSHVQRYVASSGVRAELLGFSSAITQTPTAFQWVTCDGRWSLFGAEPLQNAWRLDEVGDQHGNTVALSYDVETDPLSDWFGVSRLLTVTAASGQWLALSYDERNLISGVQTSIGTSASYAYTIDGQLETATDARGYPISYLYDALNRLTTVIDANGHAVARNSFDDLGRVSTQLDAAGHSTSFAYPAGLAEGVAVITAERWVRHDEYDRNGRLVAQAQCEADGTSCRQFSALPAYDENRNPTVIQDIRGNSTVLAYDSTSNGSRITAITDTQGYVATFQYDDTPSHNLFHAAGPGDWARDFDYDTTQTPIDAQGITLNLANTRLSQITDSLGHVTQVAQDTYGQTTQVTDANGHTVAFEYDAFGRTTAITDADGQRSDVSYAYDVSGSHVTLTQPSPDGSAPRPRTRYDRDPAGNLLARTENYQDGEPGPAADEDLRTTFGYDAVGNLVTITDTRGYVTNIAYDNRNLPAEVARHGVVGDQDEVSTWSYDYDADQNVRSIVDPNGHETTAQYDVFNRPRSITYPGWGTVNVAYDDAAGLVTVTDPGGRATVYTYDSLQRLRQVQDPDENVTQLSYDPFVRLLDLIDAKNVRTHYDYDPELRLRAVTEDADGAAVTTEYDYDDVGNLTLITDPRGKATEFGYTARNELHTRENALGQWTFTPDGLSRIVQITDPKGIVGALAYDGVDRLTGVSYDGDPYVVYGYDAAGNRRAMTDTTGTTTYGYDGLNRLIAKHVEAYNRTVAYGYDDAGHVTDLSYPGGHAVGYAYDDAGRLHEVTDGGQTVAHYGYDDSSRLAGGSVGPDVSFDYHYYPRSETDYLTYTLAYDWSPTTIPYRFTYRVDNAGNRIREEGEGGLVTPPSPPVSSSLPIYLPVVFRSYSASSLAGLGGSDADGAPAVGSAALNPDVIAAIFSSPHRPPEAAPDVARPGAVNALAAITGTVFTPFTRTITYTYDSLYRLTDVTSTDISYTFGYGYDAGGNRTSGDGPGGTKTYSYDDANRLTYVDAQAYTWDDNGNLTGDGVRTLTYDAANRLTQVVSGTLTIDYTYNGDGDLVAQTVGGGTTKYTLDPLGLPRILEAWQGDDVTAYVHGLGPLAEQTGDAWRYYGLDALGSVRFVIDGEGEQAEISAQYTYSPFGEPYQADGPSPLFRYAGEPWTAEAGLIPLRARHYDPALGRFLTRDPFPGVLRLPQTLNPYAYATNNPVNLTDPSGLSQPGLEIDPDDPEMIVPAIGGPPFEGIPVQPPLFDLAPFEIRGSSQLPAVRPVAGVKLPSAAGTAEGIGSSIDLPAPGAWRNQTYKCYSIFMEVELRPGVDYPGRQRAWHFEAANEQMYQQMQLDPAFADAFEGVFPGIREFVRPGPYGRFPQTSPFPGSLTWHHHPDRLGILQLVPSDQHAVGSPLFYLLHPSGRGGMSESGGDR